MSLLNVVATQYLFDIFLVLFVMCFSFLIYKKKKREAIILSIISAAILVIFKTFIYFNFANADNRQKEEVSQSKEIFQSKMIPKKEVKEFNYNNEYNNVSKDISKEEENIHKNVKNH